MDIIHRYLFYNYIAFKVFTLILICSLRQKNEGDIMITDVRCVAADFHARYKAQERTYVNF